jgi:predicted aldo/keto reductase-like oxidoreductase
MENLHVNRRQFLASASIGSVACAIGVARDKEPERRNEQTGMSYGVLGRTNLNVSRLAYGSAFLSMDRLGVFSKAVERGVNLVHVNTNYMEGKAMQALGAWLKTLGNRDKIFLSMSFTGNVDKALTTLNTDHLDILFIPKHKLADVTDAKISYFWETISKPGKARFPALVTHDTPAPCTQAGIDSGLYDLVLTPVGLTSLEAMRPAIASGKQKNVGIVAMKSLQNTKDKLHPGDVVKGLLAAGVTSVLKSLNTYDEVDLFTAAAGTVPDKADLNRAIHAGRELAAEGGLCDLCGECVGCPAGVNIPGVLRTYQYYHQQLGETSVARSLYAQLPVAESALSCQDCGACEAACPARVPVRMRLREAHAALA